MPPPWTCQTEEPHGAANLSVMMNEDGIRKLVLFHKGTKLSWMVPANEFKEVTRKRFIRLFREAITTFKQLGLGDNVPVADEPIEGQGHTAHITFRNANNDGIYACSFFPPYNGDLMVTRHMMVLDDKKFRWILMHELGHILGLRHYTAEEEDTVVYGPGDDQPNNVRHLWIGKDHQRTFMQGNGYPFEEPHATDMEVLQMMYGEKDREVELVEACERAGIGFERVEPQWRNRQF